MENMKNCTKTCGNMVDDFKVTMAYVPWQHLDKVYEPAKALKAGTLFPELDKPFYGRKGMKR